MEIRIPNIRRFLYSHYFFGGVRQAVGMLLPVLVLGGIFGQYAMGLVATFGAQCLAIIDQPAGPQRHRTNEMLGGALLGTSTVAITGLASSYPLILWLVVIAQCFLYSMFTVFGKRGGLIGFACLLLMTLTMHSPMAPDEVIWHALATLGGSLFYLLFSFGFRKLFWLREERQALSVALFSTADYVAARANLYDENADLDDAYRLLMQRQSLMTENQQAARDLVLRALPRGKGYRESDRVMLWNMFVDMLQLLDTLVATHTDYVLLRLALAGNDCLIFMRDALLKMSLELNRIAFDISRGRSTSYRNSAKAELRAIEYEIEQFKQSGLGEQNPEILVLLVQVLRRMRNAARLVDRLTGHTRAPRDATPTSAMRMDKSLTRFMSRQEVRLGMLTSNLRLDSPHCRYALRVTLAAAIALGVIGSLLPAEMAAHSYWVLLTIVIVMKPGFAMTRQRNGWRLTGTLIGCLLALALFLITDKPAILFAVLLIACVMGNSLVLLNYMGSAIFNTLFVVLVFHFVAPGTVSLGVIGERALDTLVGCILALLCSYVLPWWEANYMAPLARAASRANLEYLRAGLRYIDVIRQHGGTQVDENNADVIDADVMLRLTRKNVHVAFSNYAEAFYRMMSEPRYHQTNVPEYNNLLIQNHVLASQITATVPTLALMPQTPPPVQQALDDMVQTLQPDQAEPPTPNLTPDTLSETPSLLYPVKQMLRACGLIRQELAAVAEPSEPSPTNA